MAELGTRLHPAAVHATSAWTRPSSIREMRARGAALMLDVAGRAHARLRVERGGAPLDQIDAAGVTAPAFSTETHDDVRLEDLCTWN
jgi:hypothetical protein